MAASCWVTGCPLWPPWRVSFPQCCLVLCHPLALYLHSFLVGSCWAADGFGGWVSPLSLSVPGSNSDGREKMTLLPSCWIALLARCHWLSQVFCVVAGSYRVYSILTFACLKWSYKAFKSSLYFLLGNNEATGPNVLICDTCSCVLPAWWSVLVVDLAIVREECCCLKAVTCGWGSLHLSFSSFLVFWGVLLVLFFLRQDFVPIS